MLSWHYQIQDWERGSHFSVWENNLERIAFCPPSGLLHFKWVQCVFLFSLADHCAAVLSYCCNPPQSEYYILMTPQLLGWTGLKTTRRSTRCHKADLTVRSAQSCFWFLIYDSSLLSSFSTGTVQCFNLTGSQSSWFSPVEVWGSKRNASEVCSDAQKLIQAVTEGKAHVTSSSFFQALSQPFTGPSTFQSSRALFCNSLRESGIKYLYSNINETTKKAGSSKHLDIGKKRRKEGILPKLESDVYYLFDNNQRSQAGPKFKYTQGVGCWLMPEHPQQGEGEREIIGRSKKIRTAASPSAEIFLEFCLYLCTCFHKTWRKLVSLKPPVLCQVYLKLVSRIKSYWGQGQTASNHLSLISTGN